MTIVSVSLNSTILNEMDKLEKSHGFSGRSELVRAAIRNMISEEKKRQELTGTFHAIFLALHDEDSDEEVTEIRHLYDKLIITHIHSKIDRDKCLEIFLLNGDAHDVNEMTRKFQASKNMDNVQLVVV